MLSCDRFYLGVNKVEKGIFPSNGSSTPPCDEFQAVCPFLSSLEATASVWNGHPCALPGYAELLQSKWPVVTQGEHDIS